MTSKQNILNTAMYVWKLQTSKYLKSQEKLKLHYLEYINGKKYLDIFFNAVVNVIPTLVY